MDLVSIVIAVLILCLIYWAIHRLAAAFGLSPQIVTVLDVLLVIIAILWLIRVMGYGGRVGL